MRSLSTIATIVSLIAAGPAFGVNVLISDADSQDSVETRLTGLGHTVYRVPVASMDASFDYSVYDVLIFNWGDVDVPDVPHLVAAVDAELIGVAFMQAHQSAATAVALGLLEAAAIRPLRTLPGATESTRHRPRWRHSI